VRRGQARPFLDRPAARLIALAVLLLCIVLLLYLHRDDLWPGETAALPSDDPAAACIAERFADIDALIAEGTVEESDGALFKQRAEAMCRSTVGDQP
jgi:hypothetical protein